MWHPVYVLHLIWNFFHRIVCSFFSQRLLQSRYSILPYDNWFEKSLTGTCFLFSWYVFKIVRKVRMDAADNTPDEHMNIYRSPHYLFMYLCTSYYYYYYIYYFFYKLNLILSHNKIKCNYTVYYTCVKRIIITPVIFAWKNPIIFILLFLISLNGNRENNKISRKHSCNLGETIRDRTSGWY